MGTRSGRRAGAEDYTARARGTMRRAHPRKAARRGGAAGGSSASELIRRPDVPECARQIVGAGVVAVQRARVADRRILAKHVVDAEVQLESLDRQGVVPPDLYVVVKDRVERVVDLTVRAARHVRDDRVAAGFLYRVEVAQVPADRPVARGPAPLGIGPQLGNCAV